MYIGIDSHGLQFKIFKERAQVLLAQIMLFVFPLDNTLKQIHEAVSWQTRTLL
jgi:hypothetical protein